MHNENERNLYSRSFTMFDVGFTLSSDSKKIIDEFYRSYRKMERDDLKSTLSFKVITDKEKTKIPYLIFNSKKYYLPESENISPYLNSFIINRLLDSVNEYFVIHAGVVENNGEGLLICGETSFGKTTLVLKLMEKGFNLISDEYAPIERKSRMISPFPQSLAIEDWALENLWEGKFRQDRPYYRHKFNPKPKQIIDIEDVTDKKKFSNHSFLKNIIFLINDLEDEDKNIVNVVFLKNSEKLIPKFSSIRGVTIVDERKIDNYPSAIYAVAKDKMAVSKFYECYEKHRDDIISMEKKIVNRPDFSTPPKLNSLNRSKASKIFLQHLRNFSPYSSLFNEFKGKYSDLLFSIGVLLEGVQCFTLKPGELENTADIVCNKIK